MTWASQLGKYGVQAGGAAANFGPYNINTLVVGAGGGGGGGIWTGAGGGGAGAYAEKNVTGKSAGDGTFTVTVGAGGAGGQNPTPGAGPYDPLVGATGGATTCSFDGSGYPTVNYGIGGGGGAPGKGPPHSSPNRAGVNGSYSSAGGGMGYGSAGGTSPSGPPIAAGYPGGLGATNAPASPGVTGTAPNPPGAAYSNLYFGGGGGGAGAAGGIFKAHPSNSGGGTPTQINGDSGAGGIGRSWPINSTYYAGGGGGGTYRWEADAHGGDGGLGGGGHGGTTYPNATYSSDRSSPLWALHEQDDGAVGSGGGGGGAYQWHPVSPISAPNSRVHGANGGSGTVIIALSGKGIATSVSNGVQSTVGNYTLYTFTTSGTLTL